jgi:septal ring factor EnvC (AmiA/AmiB activator)
MHAVLPDTPATSRSRVGLVARSVIAALFAPVVAGSVLAQQPVGPGRPIELARRATDRLRTLQQEAGDLAAAERTVLGQLRQLELERQIHSEEIQQADAEVAAVVAAIAVTDRQITQLLTEREADRPALQARLVELYKLGQGRYLRLLLSTPDLRRLGHASRTIAALALSDRQRIARYQSRLSELAATRQVQASHQQRLSAQRGAADAARTAAARAVAERNAMVREIDQKRDLNAKLASELQAAHQKLEATLTGAAAVIPGPALPMAPFRGVLPWPVAGVIERPGAFAASLAAGTGGGVEIAAPEGSEVHAVHDGIVAYAGSFDGLGNLVILDHGARSFSLYGNLLDMAVGRDVHVDRGEMIGRVGRPPTAPAALYFELRIEGRPVDPILWLGSPERR